MANSSTLVCDGCGQIASAEHVARRLKRLEWATRYRPVHIHTLFLGAFSPHDEKDFLYAPGGEFQGEAALLLAALGISAAGKAAEAVHAALKNRLAAVATRIRRSLKPKRVMAVTAELALVLDDILAMDLGCPVLLDNGKPFRLEGRAGENGAARLREALAGTPAD